MASNRSGKTLSGAYELVCHATGEYPEFWTGKRFDRPINAHGAGMTGITTRDTVQRELLGELGRRGEGMIPAHAIISTSAKPGIPNGIETVLIRHKSGGTSSISFRSYDQGVKGFQGFKSDCIWLDEECPMEIYNECLLRTMTTKGIIYVTFTPQWGLTEFIINFHKHADLLAGAKAITALEASQRERDTGKRFKAVIQAGWQHAPWLDEDSKTQMLQDTPPHLRMARSEGRPSIGAGNVYPVDIESILCAPFEIPAHYRRLYAVDVGWNNTAALFMAIDPDTDTCYLYAEYKAGQKEPTIHAQRIREMSQGWIPGLIDPASRGRSQKDGQQLLHIYRQLGLQLRVADNAVEAGVQRGWDRLSVAKVKVFKTLHQFVEEFVIYRRDEKGHIVKEHDHLMDCFRYLMNGINVARSQHSSNPFQDSHEGDPGGKRYF
jgi:phage terminase large subunit-like protein